MNCGKTLPHLVRITNSVSVSDAIMNFSGGVLTVYGPNETASIFATYPSEFLSLGSSFLDQVSGWGQCGLPINSPGVTVGVVSFGR